MMRRLGYRSFNTTATLGFIFSLALALPVHADNWRNDDRDFGFGNGEILSNILRQLGRGGLQGPTGPTGPAGAKGATGATGAAGAKGATGAVGAVGPQGPAGARGPEGIRGATGAPGQDGANGLNGANGDKGDKGDKGEQGDAGPVGPAGAQGLTGPQGERGADGAPGNDGLPGEPGPAGPAGAAGATGATGATGEKGDKGDKGDRGETGPQGAVGPMGPPGPAGDGSGGGAAMSPIMWSGGCSRNAPGTQWVQYCLDAEDFSTAGNYLTVDPGGTITFTQDGYYRINFWVHSAVSGDIYLQALKNNASIHSTATSAMGLLKQTFFDLSWYFSAGDTFMVKMFGTGSTNVIYYSSAPNNTYGRMQVNYLGP